MVKSILGTMLLALIFLVWYGVRFSTEPGRVVEHGAFTIPGLVSVPNSTIVIRHGNDTTRLFVGWDTYKACTVGTRYPACSK